VYRVVLSMFSQKRLFGEASVSWIASRAWHLHRERLAENPHVVAQFL
jgi:hypothetical protein